MKSKIFAVLASIALVLTFSSASPAMAAPATTGVAVTAGVTSWSKWYWCHVLNQFCEYKRVCYIVRTPSDGHLFGRYICIKVKL